MSEWKKTALSEVINLIGGGTPKTSNHDYWRGEIPWLSVADFNSGRKYVYETEKSITQLGLEKSSTKLLQKGDIIISARGTVGVVAMLERQMAFNQSCYGVRAKEKSLNDYVFYLLKNTINNLQQISHGAVFDTITRDTFKEINIFLPPIPEQKAIATVLSSLDDKIDLLHRQNQTLEAMAETLFRQWFVEDVGDDWDKGVIPDEFDYLMGLSPPGSSYNEDCIGIPMFQGNADFEFRFPKNRIYTTKAKRLADPFDTLISVRAPVGAQNMANVKCCIGRGVARFRYKGNAKYYTYTYFKMKSLMDDFKLFNDTGTVFGSISKKDFDTFSIIIPPRDLIDKFQNEVKPIDNKIIKNCHQIQTLTLLRDTLLPKLMSGEVRVQYYNFQN
jgi:type I restriction enzyme S subunit